MNHTNHKEDQEYSQQTTQTDGRKTATTTQVVPLNDGDTFDLIAEAVTKKINGKEISMLAYNGQIPGPRIEVSQGAEIRVNFTNNIDEETTLHSHGLRLDNQSDGVPDMTQPPVKVGETYTYTLKFPDAGVYWYHPHMREDRQQELGMYGNFYVQPQDPGYWNAVNREEFLFLDDIALSEDGDVEAFYQDSIKKTLMGRFGNTFLINGNTNHSLDVQKGEIVRFFLTNSANTRTFNIHFDNNIQMKVVGGDASKYEQEFFTDSIIISPSERVTFEAYFPEDIAVSQVNLWHTSGKNPNYDKKDSQVIATVQIASDQINESFSPSFQTLRTNTDVVSDIDNFRAYFDKPADKSIRFDIDMNIGGMEHGSMNHDQMLHTNHAIQKIEWEDHMPMMNRMSNDKNVVWKIVDEQTGKTNDEIDWEFKKGDVVKIKIYNDQDSMHPMQHPLHIHGQRFLVLNTNGVKNENLVWKDTTLIQTGDTVEILVDMSNPGDWMIHCHIAEHLHSGMAATFTVNNT